MCISDLGNTQSQFVKAAEKNRNVHFLSLIYAADYS